ncbi:MAG: hypothetical protein J6K53_15345 [Roseburia sp.]|nr:hypothetical protein [Roseburia sp.]
MPIQSIEKWNLWEQPGTVKNEERKSIKDVIPELKDRKISTDSVTFSREGMAALRSQVQSMPGHIDVEEIMRMREILPKLCMNPSDDFLWAMRDDMQSSLNAIKQSKGNYTLDDLISIRMEAYVRQYDALQQSYEGGLRDIYVSDGIDENGKLQYHKVTQEEDTAYLNQAFDSIADSLKFSAESQEIKRQIDEAFGGKGGLPVALPEGYGERLADILKKASLEYADRKEQGQYADASGLALKYLNEDAEFADAMRMLFSNVMPMP